ncbi:MAG: tetratricopeptide repeat protein [Tabrizicola sp.]|uniref:tetratricopeptide repeat protein n=1 Tax=Tabrizicola sp. TaxID=2005166 RepID=UPI00273629CD|nr:tetratricopeptide repeat protein [Tabrizicola sp.]MDP3263014.1 tetratricopeptide repeat protein [Tabrizicola sp.]MDP3648549.1 tetratricopeptide repeat protein [Paracoccaceae bacterium]MDZ4067421.1 tetratricopeptide repeat protein [Tabrizicola sp.]
MRHPVLVALCLGGTVALAGCEKSMSDAQVERAIKDVNVIDESNLNDVMLTVADPGEAVAYFQGALQKEPDRVDLKRGLAKSLVRAKKPTEAAQIWTMVAASPEGGPEDRVMLADALIRSNQWDKAKAELNQIPPTHETFDRYRLEAMVADSDKNWKKADSFYEIASGLTTKPAGVLNNWGFSKLTRGDNVGAEKLFTEALTYDPSMFTAKNNLVLARSAQRKYDLPVVNMTQTERAELLYTMALAAIKQGDVTVGKGLLAQAVETHPRYFEAAARSLEALDANVSL